MQTDKLELDCEVVVVGAGPAGASVAYYLAKANRRVVLIDRQSFPRDKVCGDFIGPAAIFELQKLGVTSLPEFQASNVINRASIFVDGKCLITKPFPKMECVEEQARVIPRKKLDMWIFEAAKKAGAQILQDTLITGYQTHSTHIEVKTRSANQTQTLKAHLLIGADGTNSVIAHQLHGQPPAKTSRTICIRGYFQNVQGPKDQANMYFTNQSFPGYCWLFPTGENQANVGVGTLMETTPQNSIHPKELFYHLISQDEGLRSRLENASFGELQTWPQNTYKSGQQIIADRLMLVGEAAGLINPLNGEGIQYALQSGYWASQTALNALERGEYTQKTLGAYADRVESELGYGFRVSALIIQLIRNRSLNPLWLNALQAIIAAAEVNPDYEATAAGILAGTKPSSSGLTPSFLFVTAQQAAVQNTLDVASQSLQDPAALPRNVIQIAQTPIQAALNTAQNPLGFMDWTMQTALSLLELAAATPGAPAELQSQRNKRCIRQP